MKSKLLQGHIFVLILFMIALTSKFAGLSALSEEEEEEQEQSRLFDESQEQSPLIINTELEEDEGNPASNDDSEPEIDREMVDLDDKKGNSNSFSDELTSDEYDDMMNIDFEHDSLQQDHEWDVLIFTQQWPVTTCFHWRETDRTHSCLLPMKKEFWTIHGIWPTKLGHFGPSFCNKTADFDLNQIQAIMDRLLQLWPDIDGESKSHDWLWKHEWLKHGTCAALLESLNDELKYFGQGINWSTDYSMTRILSDANIHPDSNNTIIALHSAIVKELGGKNPSIHCLYDGKTDISYLSEIRICFNKTLDLTDCDGVKRGDAVTIDYPGGTVITNCHISNPVHYPSLVPPVQRSQKIDNWKFPVVNMYKLLQFIMWFTL